MKRFNHTLYEDNMNNRIAWSADPEKMYKGILTRNNMNLGDLEEVLLGYIQVYKVQVAVDSYHGQISHPNYLDDVKENMARQLAKEILNGEVFPTNFKTEFDPYTGNTIVSCKMEVFDFNKYNIVFRPERCI